MTSGPIDMSSHGSGDLPKLIRAKLDDGSEVEIANLPDCALGHKLLREILRRFPGDRLFTTDSTRFPVSQIKSVCDMPLERFLMEEVTESGCEPAETRYFTRLRLRLRAGIRGYETVGVENIAVTASGNGFAVIQKLYNDARGQKKFFFTTDWGQFPIGEIDIGSIKDPALNPLPSG